MLVIPLVADLDVKHVEVAVIDNDHSMLSGRIMADIEASPYLEITRYPGTYAEAMAFVEKGGADASSDHSV